MDDDGAGDASTAGYAAAMEEMVDSTAAAEARVAQLEALYEPARPGGRTPDVTARGRAYLMLACGNDEQHRHMHHNVWRPVLALGDNKLWLPDVGPSVPPRDPLLSSGTPAVGVVLDGVGRVLVEYETDSDSEHRGPMFAGTGTREAFEHRTVDQLWLCNHQHRHPGSDAWSLLNAWGDSDDDGGRRHDDTGLLIRGPGAPYPGSAVAA